MTAGDEAKDVAVIGGGLAGLSCAVALADAGYRVTVLEAGERLGGRAQSWDDPVTGDRVDIGPHILLNQYRNMRGFLQRLGTERELVWRRDAFMTLVDRGQALRMRARRLPAPLHFLPSMFSARRLVPLRDLASNWRIAWRALRLTEDEVLALDQEPAVAWLRRQGATPRIIEWFWATACLAIMNVPVERCSTGALMRFFKHMVGHGDLAVGFAGIGLGDLYAEPAATAICSAGGQVLRAHRVRALVPSPDGMQIVLDSGRRMQARQVVAAVPPAELAALEGLQDAFAAARQFEPSPYISTYLWFGRKLTSDPFWARVWSPSGLNSDFYDLSNIRRAWRDRPSIITSNIIYSQAADRLSDEEIVLRTVEELAEFVPEAVQVPLLHARVHRLPMAIPCPYPGTERLRPPAITPFPSLFLAGDWTDTGMPCCMESAVYSGLRAAEAVLASDGRGRRLAQPLPPLDGLAALFERRAARRPRANGL